MKDYVKFQEYMTLLGEIHNKRISDTLKSVYWEKLRPYDDVTCIQVFKTLVGKSKFFPSPGNFDDLLTGDTTDEDTAYLAWKRVCDAIRRHGAYKSVKFVDPAITESIQAIGGWLDLCRTPEKELKWKQKEFLTFFKSLSKQRGYLQNTHFAGLIEDENFRHGYDVPEAIEIDITGSNLHVMIT